MKFQKIQNVDVNVVVLYVIEKNCDRGIRNSSGCSRANNNNNNNNNSCMSLLLLLCIHIYILFIQSTKFSVHLFKGNEHGL